MRFDFSQMVCDYLLGIVDGISKVTNIDGFYLADESHARNYPKIEGLTSSSTFVDKVQRIINFINFSHE